MYAQQSGVFKIIRFFPKRLISFSNLKNIQKMSWEEEKRKFLSMSGEEKNKHCNKWKDIPTWKAYSQIKRSLSPKISALADKQIDYLKNEELADKISIFSGDITTLEVDAIVNAANKSLLGGGGVDGAIHRGAGGMLKSECQTLGGCDVGEAKITGAYKLPAKYVIHTVGPQGEKPNLLQNCYVNSLKLAVENNVRTIAFPCISTGVYGYPNEPAAHVSAFAVRKQLEENFDKFDRIIFCLFMEVDVKAYEGVLQSYFPIK